MSNGEQALLREWVAKFGPDQIIKYVHILATGLTTEEKHALLEKVMSDECSICGIIHYKWNADGSYTPCGDCGRLESEL